MFKAKVKDGKVVVEEDPEEVFQLGGYGKFEGGELVLKTFEAMNLLNRQKLEIYDGGEEVSKGEFYRKACKLEDRFPEKLLVYEDLRKRGFVVRPGYSFPCDLRVYERGTSFAKDEKKLKHVKWLLDVVKTNSSFTLSEKVGKLKDGKNIRAEFALGIVDEEGDVTYYEVDEEVDLNDAGEVELEKAEPVKGFLKKGLVVVWDDPEKVYEPNYFGKKRSNRLELNLLEAVYLQSRGLLEVEKNGGEVDPEELWEVAEREDREFEEKYEIYEDLRNKGFLVRSGFKFGTHFRVYDRGVELKRGQKSPDEHTKWVVHAVPAGFTWSYPELSRFVRLALNIRSKPTLGVVNKNKKYYRIRRIKP